MAIDFPSSPSNNQVYVDTTSGYSFTYITPPGVWKSTGLSVPATDRQYVWTNTQTFSNVITFSANVLASIVNAASHTVGSATVANGSGIYTTGAVNAASHTVGATFTANATLVNAAAVNITGQVNTATLYAATSANVGANVQSNTTSLLISSNSTVNAIVNAVSIKLSNTTATPFVANTTGVYHTGVVNAGSFSSTGSILANTLTLTGSIAANNISLTGGLYPLSFSGAPNITWVIGTLSLNNTSAANNDIDITNYVTNSPTSLSSVIVYVQAQYIANTNAPQISSGASTLAQSHFSKSFKQNVWANTLPSYVLEGGTVFETYSGDATNFPAGAINAVKCLLIANTVGVYLRLIQRTTPAAQSATYYSYRIEIQKW